MEGRYNQGAKTWEKIVAVVFGIIFICVLLAIAIFIPRPTEFQIFVFRVVLALAAAGMGAVIPGLIHVQAGPFVRAGGAIALFVVVFWFNPPRLLASNDPLDESLTVHIPEQTTLKSEITVIIAIDHSAPRFQPSCPDVFLQTFLREGDLRARTPESLIAQLRYLLKSSQHDFEVDAKKAKDGMYDITCTLDISGVANTNTKLERTAKDLKAMKERLGELKIRTEVATKSWQPVVASLEKQNQSLRSPVAVALGLLKSHMERSENALNRGDIETAKRDMDLAEKQIQFLNEQNPE